jgi:hypothetical protein
MSGADVSFQPEELLAIMEATEHGSLGRAASRFHRNLAVCVQKRQAFRRAALDRRRMSHLWLPDDGLPFSAVMVRLEREHRKL